MRIISATHRSLSEQVEAGEFRQDLFYRLNVIELKMPSLREIPEDIPLMVEQVVERLARQSGMPPPAHHRRGDAGAPPLRLPRQRARAGEHPRARAGALLATTRSPRATSTSRRPRRRTRSPPLDGALGTRGLPLHDFLDQVEREAIIKALEATRFNKTAAAKLLGITFRSLRYRLDRLGID